MAWPRANHRPRGTRHATRVGRGSLALTGALGAAVALLTPASAAAFCRSTTCTGDDCPRDAEDCKTTGAPLFWVSMCVGFSLQRDGSVNLPYTEIERVAEASFVEWSDVQCPTGPATLAFSRLADVTCRKAEYNPDDANANIVLFQDNKWNYTGEYNTLAKTTVTYDNDTGEIFDADIELNQAFNEFTTGDSDVVYDLQSILTHEIGHFFGLDHSADLNATMTPGYDQGSTELRTIEADDIAGVCAIYPPERQAACSPTPRGGLGDLCAFEQQAKEGTGCSCRLGAPPQPGSSRSWGASWAWVLGLGATAARRARRRA
jgi:predicted Zn-dependent protease with MMP-like domain